MEYHEDYAVCDNCTSAEYVAFCDRMLIRIADAEQELAREVRAFSTSSYDLIFNLLENEKLYFRNAKRNEIEHMEERNELWQTLS